MSATPEQIAEAVDGIAEWSAISDGDEACLHQAASFIRAQAERVRVLESALRTISARRGERLSVDEPWKMDTAKNGYGCGSYDAFKECADVADAALRGEA